MERPGLVLVAVLAGAIGLVLFTSRFHNADRPLMEKADEKAAADAMEEVKNTKKRKEDLKTQHPEREKAYEKFAKGAIKAEIEVENAGVFEVELYPEAAPYSVGQIVRLAKSGFYDGIRFHRVVPKFVAQAGDPGSKRHTKADFNGKTPEQVSLEMNLGKSGSGTTVPLEVKLPHLPYTIGMARSQTPDSGDSQFFFNLADNSSLDSGYCAFGRVTKGQENLAKIAMGDAITHFTIK